MWITKDRPRPAVVARGRIELPTRRTAQRHRPPRHLSHTARQVGWIAETLHLEPSTVAAERAETYLATDRQPVTPVRRQLRAVDARVHIGL